MREIDVSLWRRVSRGSLVVGVLTCMRLFLVLTLVAVIAGHESSALVAARPQAVPGGKAPQPLMNPAEPGQGKAKGKGSLATGDAPGNRP